MQTTASSSTRTLSRTNQLATDFISGAIAAAIAKTSCAPLERVKLLLQIRSQEFSTDNTRILFNIISRVYREQGIIAFWRGNLPNVIRYFPLQAFTLTFKEQFKQIFVSSSSTNAAIIISSNICSAGVAGCTAVTIIYPLDLTRTRLAADMGRNAHHSHPGVRREFAGISHCISTIYHKTGFLSLYRGWSVTCMCYFIYRGIQIGGYDASKKLFNIDVKNTTNICQSFMMSYAWTNFAMSVAYPLDTIRRKMMMEAGVSNKKRLYYTNMECVHAIYNNGGYRGFYRGLVVNYARGFGSALVLVLFDLFREAVDTS